jgi:hypothetical protein
MIKKMLSFVLIFQIALYPALALAAGKTNVGQFQIRSTPGSQAASSLFEVNSTSKGAIPAPKMSQAQRDAIASPTAGLAVYNTDTNKLNVYSGSAWGEVGSGQGGINYLSPDSTDAESGVGSWLAYGDAAGTSPVDGTGGTPTVTCTRSTASPLRGVGSFRLTKDAANRQGEGCSVAFTIAVADKGKPLTVSFEYSGSANFVAGSDSATGDIVAYVYDVTNSTLIQLAPYKLVGGTGNNWKFSGSFQAASNSVSYKLILHVAGTHANAYTVDYDTVSVGPTVNIVGSPITDWTSQTVPTLGGTTTPPARGTGVTESYMTRRVGDSLEFKYDYEHTGAGTVGSGSYLYSLPSGLSIDTTKLSVGSSQIKTIGSAYVYNGTTEYNGSLIPYSSTQLAIDIFTSATASTFAGSSNASYGGATLRIHFEGRVPIAGWGSTTTLSQDTDTRVVAFSASTPNGTPSTSYQDLSFQTIDFDTHGAYSSGTYTVPVAGIYDVVAAADFNGSVTTGTYMYVQVLKNGSSIRAGLEQASGNSEVMPTVNATIKCIAGDTIKIQSKYTGTITSPTWNTSNTSVTIRRESGPATVAASEQIVAVYQTAAGQSISNSTTSLVDLASKVVDTHGAVTTGTWKFTAPRAGYYDVSLRLTFNSAAWTAGNYIELDVHKNGTGAEYILNGIPASGTAYLSTQLVTTIYLNAGDYLEPKIYQNSGGSRSLFTDAKYNEITIRSRQ